MIFASRASLPGSTLGGETQVGRAVLVAALALSFVLVGPAHAQSNFTIQGAFDDVNDLAVVDFAHGGGPFRAFTSQWAGELADGTQIPPPATPAFEGFDAVLWLFDGPTGSYLDASDDGCFVVDCTGTIGGTTFVGGRRDAGSLGQFDTNLAAGDYTVVLSAFANYLNTPADNINNGFDNGGQANSFTSPNFRLHLLGIDSINEVTAPQASVSGPFIDLGA